MGYEEKIKLIKIAGVIFALVLVVSIVLIIFNALKPSTPHEKSRFGDSVTIANLNQYTNNRPSDKDALDHITYDLLRTINQNLDSPIGDNSLKDVLIRKDTFEQTDDKKTGIHTVKFIVDIASIRQSYAVSYQWADDKSKDTDEWGTVVTCLPEDKRIYKEFQCKDMFSILNANVNESLSELLPHTSDFYVISQYVNNGETTISIQIMTNNNSSRTSARYENYKGQALTWLKEKAIDVNKYRIEFRNLSNTIVSTQPRKDS